MAEVVALEQQRQRRGSSRARRRSSRRSSGAPCGGPCRSEERLDPRAGLDCGRRARSARRGRPEAVSTLGASCHRPVRPVEDDERLGHGGGGDARLDRVAQDADEFGSLGLASARSRPGPRCRPTITSAGRTRRSRGSRRACGDRRRACWRPGRRWPAARPGSPCRAAARSRSSRSRDGDPHGVGDLLAGEPRRAGGPARRSRVLDVQRHHGLQEEIRAFLPEAVPAIGRGRPTKNRARGPVRRLSRRSLRSRRTGRPSTCT